MRYCLSQNPAGNASSHLHILEYIVSSNVTSSAYVQMTVVVVRPRQNRVTWVLILAQITRVWMSSGQCKFHQNAFSILARQNHSEFFPSVLVCRETLNRPFVEEDRGFHMLLARVLHMTNQQGALERDALTNLFVEGCLVP